MTEKEALNLIEAIETVDLKKDDAYESVLKILHERIKGFKPITFKLNYHDDLYYVRARILGEPENLENKVSGHSYNPFLDKISYGRVNKNNQQIFYLGRTRITSLAEVNIIENKKEKMRVGYALSRWQPIKKMKIGAILEPDTMNELEADEVQGLLKFLNEQFELIKKDETKRGQLELYMYFAKKFRERVVKGMEYKHKITSALSNFILDQNSELQGLMYQSVKWSNSYNLAVKKSAVDEYNFKPTHFIKMIFERRNVDELKELDFKYTTSFDENENIINW